MVANSGKRFTYWQVAEQPAFVAGVLRSLLA
jgi:hypothetical protein